jgi:integrase
MMKEGIKGLGCIYRRRHQDRTTGTMIEGPTWWIQYHHRGRQIRQSTKTRDRSKAIEFLKNQRELASSGGMTNGEKSLLKFQFLTNLIRKNYKHDKRRSLQRLESSIKHLHSYFGKTRVIEITEEALSNYVSYRLDVDEAANATVAHELRNLHRMFVLSPEFRNSIPEFPKIRISNARQGFFEKDDFMKFRKCFNADLWGLLTFAYLTGWRMHSEIFPLTWAQVDFSASEIRLEPGTTKTDEGRTFHFAFLPELDQVLRYQREMTDLVQHSKRKIIPWVFHRDGLKIDSIYAEWKQALEVSGIGHKIPHDFRRTAVRNFERAGVPRSVAMKLVGHKTEAIYRRYAIVAKNDLVDGIKKLADYHSGAMQNEAEIVRFPA